MRGPAYPPSPHMPEQPRELSERGLCVTHPHPEWWVSSRADECEAARTVCAYCAVLELCRGWALSLPDGDRAVYAGMTPRERRQARQDAQERVSASASDERMPDAA